MGDFQCENNIVNVINANEKIAKKIYETLILNGIKEYENIFETKDYSGFKDEYWCHAVELYKSFDEQQRSIFYEIVKQVMVDTAATLISILDGSATLAGGGGFESEIIINGVDAQYLQDYFLSIAQELN